MRSYQTVEVTDRAGLRAWLAAHHTQAEPVWLVTYKKHCGARYVSWHTLVEEVLCFGWIDSLAHPVDGDRTKRVISPRRSGSIWSALNKRRVVELEAAGRMTEAGWAVIERAKADGSWTIYDDCEALVVPDDLAAALEAVSGAEPAWRGFSDSSKKGILWWIKSAKRASTRATRIAEAARLAGLGLRANFPEAKGR